MKKHNVCGLFVAAAHACTGDAEPLVRRHNTFSVSIYKKGLVSCPKCYWY